MAVNFAQEPPDPGLFDTEAEKVAQSLDSEGGRFNKNKPTQIRRFYDELVGWQERIGGDDDKFKQYEAFIRMLNAKVAYAKGRGLVGEEFARWFRGCIETTTNAKALDHFRLHFEAVLGFLKAIRN
jgi:CRISPR-associated protein Csm2